MLDLFDELMSSPKVISEIDGRRAAFRAANASLALEGFIVDSRQLAIQEEVILGKLTTEQAIAQCVMDYRKP